METYISSYTDDKVTKILGTDSIKKSRDVINNNLAILYNFKNDIGQYIAPRITYEGGTRSVGIDIKNVFNINADDIKSNIMSTAVINAEERVVINNNTIAIDGKGVSVGSPSATIKQLETDEDGNIIIASPIMVLSSDAPMEISGDRTVTRRHNLIAGADSYGRIFTLIINDNFDHELNLKLTGYESPRNLYLNKEHPSITLICLDGGYFHVLSYVSLPE